MQYSHQVIAMTLIYPIQLSNNLSNNTMIVHSGESRTKWCRIRWGMGAAVAYGLSGGRANEARSGSSVIPPLFKEPVEPQIVL